ncbi:hypothetical protein PIIN_08672 [Serendipita indica DSM 11827]|uniref:Uncharacterized protein n=1 Tax=Serendipita indica (strain DSM 11827) TaxID=1109443 RepID=G4TTR9_SERID|nr:hypothetical protein PIIN_08672 [Serendipita indica DSM 11827]
MKLLSILTLAVSGATALLSERSPCAIDTHGPFKLYSVSDGTDGAALLNVVTMGPDDSGKNTLSTLTTCDTCGKTPVYWTLTKSVLSPVFTTSDIVTQNATINLPLSYGKVNFITGNKKDLKLAPIYCLDKNTTSTSTASHILLANGHSDLFSICSFIGTIGPAHRRDVYYNQTSSGIANYCVSTKLVAKPL